MEKNTPHPQISVIMPFYNAERFIGESIESILAQTFSDFELIAIDDGSADTSAEIVRSYMARDKRIILLRNEQNLGIARTRNRGIHVARGQFIAFMDADDYSAPERLERQLEFFRQHPEVDICGSFYTAFEGEGSRDSGECCQRPTSPDEIRLSIFFLDPLGMPTVMLRSDTFKRAGHLFQTCAAEDYQLWADLSDRLTMANIPESLVYYRCWEEQISTRRHEQLVASALEVQCGLLERRLGIRLSDNEARIYSHFTLRPEALKPQELAFFRRLLLRIYRACRRRESYPTKWLQRYFLDQYLSYCLRFYPTWRMKIHKQLFKLALRLS